MILFLFLFQLLNAGQVKVSPEIVNVQQMVSIEYKPENGFFDHLGNSTPYLIVYYFDDKHSNPLAIDYQGNYENGVYKYSFRVDSSYNYAMFKFSDGLIDDNNGYQFWDIIIHKYDKEVRGSYLKRALSYLGNLTPNLDRLPDLKLAENNIKRELELFPENFVAEIALIQVKFDQGFLKEEAYKEELKRVLNRKFDIRDEQLVRAVSRGLKTLGLNNKAEEIELEFGKKFPKTELSQELIMAKLSEANDLKSFVEICEFFIKNYEDSPRKEQIMIALVSSYLQNGNYLLLKDKLSEFENIYPSVFSKIALDLSELTKTRSGITGMELRREVISNFKKAISGIDSLISSQSNLGKPRYFSNSEQYVYNYQLSGSIRQSLGEYYLGIMELDSAEFYLNQAQNILKEKADVSLYSSMIDLYKLNTNTKKVVEIAEFALVRTKFNDTIINICESIMDSVKIDSLFKIAEIERVEKLKFEEVNYKVLSGLFKTTDELYKDIESDTNEYKVVTFFATWCAPCQAMVPALEEIENLLDDDASLYSINAWENNSNRDQYIAEFLDEYDPKYTILIDETSIIPQKYGVTGLPMTYILDKNSRIRFRLEGFENQNDFVTKCMDRINYLKLKDNK
jgi:thiol-disulfide isomerase/thioredoxin